MKRIAFGLLVIFLFFAALEILVRSYLCIKNRTFQYLNPTVAIEPKYESRDELKIKGDLIHKNGYYKFKVGRFTGEDFKGFGLFKDTKFSFTINSLGFRGPEFKPQKQEGIMRVFVLGGSSVWGHGLKDNETFPSYLSEFLGRDFEVINCGFPRYKMAHIYNLFRNELITYSPDILIIYSAFNDAFEPIMARGGDGNILYKIHQILYYRWMLYTVLLEKYSVLKYKTPLPFFILIKEIPDYYYKNLVSLINMAKDKGIEVILVKQPLNIYFSNLNRSDNLRELQEKYRLTTDERLRRAICQYYYGALAEKLTEEKDIFLVDPTAALDGKEEFFFDIIHLNPDGAKLLARLVSQEIQRRYEK